MADQEIEPEVGEELFDELVAAELGDTMAEAFRRRRHAEETLYRRTHPDEGLRERKRRLTRKLISDVATTLIAARGFDAVKVSEIAARVGVSEKTIYNYFPSKESMVLDGTDELAESIATALRERPPGSSITAAVVSALQYDSQADAFDDEQFAAFLPRFVALIEETPSLHAHWLESHDHLAHVAAEELAAQAGVDPHDPEPMVAGRALVGLLEVGMHAYVTHIEAGLRGKALRDAVAADVRRAGNLLDTGLWSFNLPAGERARTQAREAVRAAEDARRQVVVALREARAAWEQARTAAREAGAEARRAGQAAHEAAHRAASDRRAQRRGL